MNPISRAALEGQATVPLVDPRQAGEAVSTKEVRILLLSYTGGETPTAARQRQLAPSV